MKPIDSITGASQGIIQGAIESGADLKGAISQIIEAARKAAAESGISEEVAVSRSIEGTLNAAESLGADSLARVKETLAALNQDRGLPAH